MATMGRQDDPESDIALKKGFDAARDICRRHARSFYFASFFLRNPAKRSAAYAVYGFCRLIDDAIDLPDDSGSTVQQRLALFRGRIDAIYDGMLNLPPVDQRDETQHALHAFSYTVHRFGIPRDYFLELAEGCAMDLTIQRYDDWPQLEQYCYRVAGVVGLIMSRVFDLQNPAAQSQAVLMGNAMQLTNILRDIGEDHARGRIYLPREDLDRFGCTEADIASGVVNEPFVHLMRFEIERARSMYRQGAEGLIHLPPDGSRQTACAMAVIYSGILRAIERQRYDVYSRRAHLTTLQKVMRLRPALKLSRRKAGQPLPDCFT